MERISGKIRILHILLGCMISISGYARKAELTISSDSIETLKENGLKSLIDTTSFIPQGMEGISKTMPQVKKEAATADTLDWDEETYKTYSIYNRLIMPLEYDKPYPTDLWKIEPYKYSFEKERHWINIPINEKNPEIEEFFQIDSIRLAIQHNILFENPLLVTGLKKELPDDFIIDEVKTPEGDEITINQLTQPGFDILNLSASDRIKVTAGKRSYWKYANKSSLQFSQNYISSNWQGGGESNLALNGTLSMKADYAHASGITLKNQLDWRASFFTAPSDTVRSWRITDDIFRVTSNFGLKAFHKWNYSSSAEFKTRFFNSFKTNSNTKLASFLSPADFSFSVGLSYSNEFKKLRIKDLNLSLSPFSYNWKWVLDSKVDVTRYGIKADDRALNQIGSRLDLKFTYNMRKNVSWDTRFYYFTTYESVESEWENTINMAINRQFSTKIFFHLKYDDKRTLVNGEDSYFQFKELLSFGFNYVW